MIKYFVVSESFCNKILLKPIKQDCKYKGFLDGDNIHA